ncbi:hypothetical protein RND81_01G000500 [Saponaria officinalis]|uniref:Pentatricopeptide repeat-containing protein n=1 Tax=Saponaria officinalis TaxID=3572 RepID=A0AAW1N598_SAPOF
MESLQSSFLPPTLELQGCPLKTRRVPQFTGIRCGVSADPWTLSDGSNLDKPKPRSKRAKNPLSDDNARRIIKGKSRYLSSLRRNQGPRAQTPRWVRRSPEQMVQYLMDDRNGHLYGKHVSAAIQAVRSLSQKQEGSYDMRKVMSSFVAKLTFREMCVVLKEQRGWRQVRDFFAWMKLQLCYRPSAIAYTIVLRAYGQVGKITLAEETFLEMLDAGCQPDEIACGTMLCTYARWGRHHPMLSFYSALQQRGVLLSLSVFNFMLSSLHKKSLHQHVILIYNHMAAQKVVPNHFTFTLVISSLLKLGLLLDAFSIFDTMKKLGFAPEEVTYSLLISSYVKAANSDQALRLYQDMRSLDIIPSNFTCASLLTLYYKNRDYSKALSLFSEMERYKIQVDEVIYGLLVRIYGKLGLYDDAEKTFEEAQRLGLLRDEKTYNAMAQVYLSAKMYTKALHTMEMMRSQNIRLSRFAYIILFKCYVMKDDLESAELAFQSLSSTGIPDTRSCSDMLYIYCRQNLFDKAKNFTLQIRKDNVVFDEELCWKVMKVYSKEGMRVEAEQFIEEISQSEPLKNTKFVRTLYITSLSEHGKVEKETGSLATSGVLDPNALELMLCLYLACGDDIKTGYTLDLLLEASDGVFLANRLVGKIIHGGDAFRAEILLGLLIKRDVAGKKYVCRCGRFCRLWC